MKKRVLLAAGGSGGHVIPAQALALELAERGIQCAFAGFEIGKNRFINQDHCVCYDISSAPLSYNIPRFTYQVTKGFFQAKRLFQDYSPDLIIGFGSYHTVSLLAAATILRVPFVLFAADAHPGRVIRLFAPFAQMTACYFDEARSMIRGRTYPVQFPLRPNFASLPSKEEACMRYGLSSDRPVLLVLGGSMGALALNTLLPKAASLIKSSISVLHLCGKDGHLDELQTLYQSQGIQATVLPYEDQMEFAYQAADCVVARSGASTISEVRHTGKRAIYIPYPYAAEDHQLKNALSAVACDQAVVLEQAVATPEVIAEHIQRLLLTESTEPFAQGFVGHAPSSSKSFVQLLDVIGCI